MAPSSQSPRRPTSPAGSDDDLVISPDSVGHTSWFAHVILVQVARMWVALAASLLVNVALVTMVVLQQHAFKPTVVTVDVSTGQPVYQNADKTLQVGNIVYSPTQIELFAADFIQSRYAYEPAGLGGNLGAALRKLEPRFRGAEERRIKDLDLGKNIIQDESRYTIHLDEKSWKITAKTDNVITVSVHGDVSITNATVYRTEPKKKSADFALTLSRIQPSPDYPLGLMIIDITSPDIL
jgi:hypothetical protein